MLLDPYGRGIGFLFTSASDFDLAVTARDCTVFPIQKPRSGENDEVWRDRMVAEMKNLRRRI